MAIRVMDDLGAPAVVFAVNKIIDTQKPTWERPVGIGLAAAGYILGGVMGIGGNFMKNVGIAAAPWAFEGIYSYIKESTAPVTPLGGRTSSRLSMRPASRASVEGIARSYQPEFEQASAF